MKNLLQRPLPPLDESRPDERRNQHDPGRRSFVGRMAVGAAALGTGLAGCGGGSTPEVRYEHGVASGDPLSDRVVLWTRLTTTEVGDVQLVWEISTRQDFTAIVRSGTTSTSGARDHTVKVDVTGLSPATTYWYRFRTYSYLSPVGRTRTLPTGSVSQVRLAVFSCANHPAGYFNAYAAAAARTDLDATVHLGDYIYEYGAGGYATQSAAALGRAPLPSTEILSLADYRARHAQYKTDPDLQALHAAAPMIAVWDDHEVTNDAYLDGAENHQTSEGSFAARKAAALQAYHEWMPTRLGTSAEVIYRSFDFGSLLSLHMLDTRLVGRVKQLDYSTYLKPTGLDAVAFTADMSLPRELLGSAQTTWLQQRLASSQATWQVLGQQVLMGRMNIPAPILLEGLSPGSGVSVSAYAALVAKAQTAPATLTPTEQAILAQPSIPYNLDAWDGYAVARETVLGTARALDKNLVVLSGDTHNAWANDLQDLGGNAVGVEFATPGVTSPGFETYFPNENPAVFAAALTQLIGPLQYCDTSRRGYMVITATPAACTAEWVYVSTVSSRTFTTANGPTWKVLPGASQRKLVAG
jgi:alkaline phosphatase D